MECHIGGGKKPESVFKMEMFGLDIFRVTSTHFKGSGTKLLDQGGLSATRVSVRILTSSRLMALQLDFISQWKENCFNEISNLRKENHCWLLTVVCGFPPNNS